MLLMLIMLFMSMMLMMKMVPIKSLAEELKFLKCFTNFHDQGLKSLKLSFIFLQIDKLLNGRVL